MVFRNFLFIHIFKWFCVPELRFFRRFFFLSGSLEYKNKTWEQMSLKKILLIRVNCRRSRRETSLAGNVCGGCPCALKQRASWKEYKLERLARVYEGWAQNQRRRKRRKKQRKMEDKVVWWSRDRVVMRKAQKGVPAWATELGLHAFE